MNPPSIISEKEYHEMQQRVSNRTIELAKLAGRAPHQIKQSDYEQAKRENRPQLMQRAM